MNEYVAGMQFIEVQLWLDGAVEVHFVLREVSGNYLGEGVSVLVSDMSNVSKADMVYVCWLRGVWEIGDAFVKLVRNDNGVVDCFVFEVVFNKA